METESVNTTHWRSNILIVLVLLASILLALILAQLDSLNELIQPLPTAVTNLPGSGGDNGDPEPGVPTPLPTSTPIPTNTATPETATATPTTTATAVPTTPPCGNIPSGWIPYVVKPGDTLYSLSIRSGASMEAISQANCLQMGKLIAGTVIYLPPTPPVLLPCGVPPQWIAYIVQPGDTLYSLAVRTGTTVYKIMRANCLTNSTIYAGQKLYLPGYPAATATPTNQPTATSTVIGIPATETATVTGTVLPTVTATVTTTVFPTTTVLAPPTATVLPPPTSTTLPTAYPPAPSPTTVPQPTAYP